MAPRRTKPVMDGYQATAEIRRLEAMTGHRTPIIRAEELGDVLDRWMTPDARATA